jgi:DNA polymerase-3 subunit delta
MRELNQRIKSGDLSGVYLFYGPETFLIKHWRKRLIEGVLGNTSDSFNLEVMQGKIPAADIISAAETLPFMGDYRVIVLKDTGLFESGRKDDSEALAQYIADGVAASTVLVFIESSVDRRGRLYKRVNENGFAAEATTPKEPDLADWAVKLCASLGKNLSRAAAYHLIRNVSTDMNLLYNELFKLVSYAGQNAEITIKDIDTLCTKSLDIKIFDLMRFIAAGDALKAAGLYQGLMNLKESPLMVLSMLARQFRYELQCGHLAKTMPQKDIAAKLALHPFAVKEFVANSSRLPTDAKISALNDCLTTDHNIKTGKIKDALAVEMLIIKLCTIGGNT